MRKKLTGESKFKRSILEKYPDDVGKLLVSHCRVCYRLGWCSLIPVTSAGEICPYYDGKTTS